MTIVMNFGGYPELVPFYPHQFFKSMIEDRFGPMSNNRLKKLTHKLNKKSSAKDKRLAILKRDNEECVYCHTYLTMATLTLDHIVPQSRGGSNKESNLCASCATCNVAKGDMGVEEFKASIKANGIPKTRNQKPEKDGAVHQ